MKYVWISKMQLEERNIWKLIDEHSFCRRDSNLISRGKNWTQDEWEKYMAWLKICIDENNDWECQEQTEPFMVTNNTWYYEFDSLPTWSYTILQVARNNWDITTPTEWYYIINLSNVQVITNKNFWNKKIKGWK